MRPAPPEPNVPNTGKKHKPTREPAPAPEAAGKRLNAVFAGSIGGAGIVVLIDVFTRLLS